MLGPSFIFYLLTGVLYVTVVLSSALYIASKRSINIIFTGTSKLFLYSFVVFVINTIFSVLYSQMMNIIWDVLRVSPAMVAVYGPFNILGGIILPFCSVLVALKIVRSVQLVSTKTKIYATIIFILAFLTSPAISTQLYILMQLMLF